MPGITLALHSNKSSPEITSSFTKAQKLMLHRGNYVAKCILKEGGLMLGHVAYPTYPIVYFERKDFFIAFEGRAYGKADSVIESQLIELAEKALHAAMDITDDIRRWIEDTDGEYLGIIADKEGRRIIAFTDVLGLLPVYYYESPNTLLLARETKFITSCRNNRELDTIACAQWLWIGYALAERTLMKGVYRAPGGMYLDSRNNGERILTYIRSLKTYNFEDKDTSNRTMNDYIDGSLALFREAALSHCKNPSNSVNILGLSGGMDSRTTAAALADADIPFDAAVMDLGNEQNRRDVLIARDVCKELGIDLTEVEIGLPDFESMRRLVRLKDGQNGTWVVFMLSFLQFMTEKWGNNATYISGDGGDKLMIDLRLRPHIRNSEELIWLISHYHAQTSPMMNAEEIMRLRPGILSEVLSTILQSYPEKSNAQKFVHFAIYEKGRKFLFEGQDRNRFFLWHTSLFYSQPLFSFGMRIPDNFKTNREYYRHLLGRLNPGLAAIPYANNGLPLTSPFFRPKLALIDFALNLPKALREPIHTMVKGPRHKYIPSDEMQALIGSVACEEKLISGEALRRLVPKMDEVDFKKLMTILLLREHLERYVNLI